MPISEATGFVAYDTAMLVKAKDQQKVEGQNALRLIEESGVRPAAVERLRNPNSTISVVA